MAIDIKIVGSANLGYVQKELGKLALTAEATTQAFENQNKYLRGNGSRPQIIRHYRDWQVVQNELRDSTLALTRANGDFTTSSFKVGNATDSMVERIQKQQLTFRQLRQEMGLVKKTYQDQMKLQASYARTWGTTAAGSKQVDLITPDFKVQAAGWDQLRTKVHFYNQVLASVSTNTINWGKNTQWAGRQLMAGITYPLILAGGLMAKTAYDVDKGLTQIVKVYGDAGEGMKESSDQIKSAAMSTAKDLTQYGQSINDTLEIQSQLASTGKTGPELQQATSAVTKARLLGELNIQDAMQATINMQEVYGFGADKLAEKFNFMNQMENETSLTMQDFVEGIPKISGIMNTLGADFEDTGVLLAAMKTAGIDAKEGGNAIKSMVFKDVAPSAKAIKVFAELTGQSIEAIVDSTKGDPIKTLQGIGRAIEDLPSTDQIAVIKEVFGIHQGSKAIGMIKALSGETEQMGKAFSIAAAGADEWAATASGELEALKASDWVKVKDAIESAKIGMVEFGKVILTAVAPALKAIGDMMQGMGDWFSGADSGKKKAVAWGIAILAATGPVIMLIGLMANLTGNMLKATSAMLNLVKGNGLVTSKQRATTLATELQTKSVNNLTKAYEQQMYMERGLMNSAFMKKDMAGRAATKDLSSSINNPQLWAAAAASASTAPSSFSIDTSTGESKKNETFAVAAKKSGEIADNSEKAARSWGKVARNTGYVAMAASTIGMMSTDSDSLVNKLSTMVFYASMLGPAMVAGLQKSGAIAKMAQIAATVKGSAMFTGIAGKAAVARTGIMAVGSSIAAMAGPIGIATVAIGGLFYMYKKRAREAREEQDALNGSVELWASASGGTLRDPANLRSGEKRTALDYEKMAKDVIAQDERLASAIEKMSESEKTKEAAIAYGMQEGNRALLRGLTPEEATEAARTAAVAINNTLASSIQLDIRSTAFINVEEVRIAEIDRVRRMIDDEVKAASTGNWFTGSSAETDSIKIKRNLEITPSGGSMSTGVLSSDYDSKLEEAIKVAYEQLSSTTGEERQKVYQKMSTDARTGLESFYDGLTKSQKEIMESQGVFDSKTMTEWMDRSGGAGALKDHLEKEGDSLSGVQQDEFAARLAEYRKAVIYYYSAAEGITQEEAEKRLDGKLSFDVIADLNIGVETSSASDAELDGAMRTYENKINNMSKLWGIRLPEAQRLALLNEERVNNGLKKTTNIRDGMNREITSTIDAVKKEGGSLGPNAAGWERSADAIDKATKAKKEYNIMSRPIDDSGQANPSVLFDSTTDEGKKAAEDMAGQFTESYKSAMAAAQEEMFTMATDELENANQSAIDAIDRDEKQMSARLDALQKSREAEFEKRSEAIDRDFEKKERKFEARWEKAMENFDTRWDKTLENFDTKWETKNEKFSAKWDATMERFDKSAEKAKKAVEAQYDSRIKKVDEAIKAEQDAENIRQRIFEKEKSRIQHLADMANRSIDISMSINSGDLDEAAKLSNDSQAAIETYDMDDAGESSQSASDKRIEGLEKNKESINKKKDIALQRIDERMQAERKALEEQRKIAEKAFKVSQEKERKILEAQRSAARKSLEYQKDREKRELDSRKASLKNRLEAERKDLARQIEGSRAANAKIVSEKRRAEDRKYSAAKKAMEKEMTALRGAIPRNEAELLRHMKQIEKSYDAYGGALKKKGDGWGKSISKSTTKHMSNARVDMQNKINWEKMGRTIATRMTKGTFNMSLTQFQRWVSGGAKPDELAKLMDKKSPVKKTAGMTEAKQRQLSGLSGIVRNYRHTGGVIDGSRGSRQGFSGKGNSQSEVNITALKGESVLNRKATRALGSGGVNAINNGLYPQTDVQKPKPVGRKRQTGDGPGLAGGFSMMVAGMMGSMLRSSIESAGKAKMAEEMAAVGNWTAYGLEAGRFGGVGLNPDQLKNASTIASVGRSLGASSRDIVIALMTAMQESTLRNISYGDRDSVGLFQQRAPWGSFDERTNPRESARMFFQGGQGGQPGLFSKRGRNDMSLAQAAQAVQVSAYPDAYAKWQAMAEALYGAMQWEGSNASVMSGGSTKGVYGYQKQIDWIKKAVPGTIITSSLRTGNLGGKSSTGSYHNRGRAIDMSGPDRGPSGYARIFNTIASSFPNSTELIHSPMGSRQLKNGRSYNYTGQTRAIHWDHVHWAMRNGGMVPGVGSGDKTRIMGEPGEFMLRKKAVDNVGPEYLKMLNSDRFINMPKSPVASVKDASTSGNIDNSVVNKYDISIDASGNAQPADVKDAVVKALTEIERRKGFDRRIGKR